MSALMDHRGTRAIWEAHAAEREVILAVVRWKKAFSTRDRQKISRAETDLLAAIYGLEDSPSKWWRDVDHGKRVRRG